MKKKFLLPVFFVMFALVCQAQNSTLVNLPDSIFSGEQGQFHVQGIAVDQVNGFIYYSFTDKLIKTDMSGNLVGSVIGFVGHLGDLTFDPETGKIYGSLEFKNDAIGEGIRKKLNLKNSNKTAFYIAIFEGVRIVMPDMHIDKNDILQTVYLKEVVNDYEAEWREGDRVVKHRFGCSGIDGVTLGPSVGDEKDSKNYLYVAYGIYGDTTRNDNNYQVILNYDISKWNKLGRKLSQDNPHQSGPKKPLAKYFVKTGNTLYGIQNLAYDVYTGNFFAAVYPGAKSQFPNYSLFVIDGHTRPVKARINAENKKMKVQTLSLLQAGLKGTKTGIRGWFFKWGSTGLFPIGNGLFYISHNKNTKDGQQQTTLYKYKWIGNDKESFVLVN